jgi:hypothetical protein
MEKFFPSGSADHELHVFSDGAPSQMKNRFMFSMLGNFRNYFHLRLLTWSFFATSHGKGPVDAVGGAVKRLVWRSVLSRRVSAVGNAKQFTETLEACDTVIKPILSTPATESRALEAVNATAAFNQAPKVVHISRDHFWRCHYLHGTTRYRCSNCETSVMPLHVEELDLDLDDTESVVYQLLPPPLVAQQSPKCQVSSTVSIITTPAPTSSTMPQPLL